jgi:hypothetical protein
MSRSRFLTATRTIVVLLAIVPSILVAQTPAGTSVTPASRRFDNGRMWTFDTPPVDHFRAAYNFTPERAWFDEVRLSALRFADYCSASFISSNGLVMTNYHCGMESVTSVTHSGEDLIHDGFVAQTLEDERKVEGLFVEQLVGMYDVTEEMESKLPQTLSDEERAKAKEEAFTAVRTRLEEQTGLRCEVVTLYQGGRYSAYVYKRYTDVRLVFSSELFFAFFGGIYDFWAYPRYSFDCDLFRVYGDDGKPLKTDHYFRWSNAGAAQGEPVFVVGNPGRTGRLVTSEQLAYQRDITMPFTYTLINDRKEILESTIRKHPERQKDYFDEVFNMVNGQEAYLGQLNGLRDEALFQRRAAFDHQFKDAVETNPRYRQLYAHAWEDISAAVARLRELAPDLYGCRSRGLGTAAHVEKASGLVGYARQLRLSEQERDKAYQGPAMKLVARTLGAPLDIATELEAQTLERQLALMRRFLPPGDPVLSLLGTWPDPASALRISDLDNTDKLKALVAGAPESIERSQDPFMRLARELVPRNQAAIKESGALNRRVEASRALLGRALFEVYGASVPPDATFTLRIADGIVDGYRYNGTKAPAFTTYYGMYDRYWSFKDNPDAWDAMMGGNAWDLPPRWKNPPQDFNMATPINFVSTTDIIGGNSGSPVINRQREIVGLAFDGNVESLPGEFIFAEDAGNRTISVHSSGILQALEKIYRAERIVAEIRSGAIPAK